MNEKEFEKKLKEELEKESKSMGPHGWVCPVCGRGLAPWVSQCGCVQPQTYTVPVVWIEKPPIYYYG